MDLFSQVHWFFGIVGIRTNSLYDSGYDFGYLLKLLTCSPMPADETEFFEILRLYFPCIYDIKYLMRSCKNLKGGLQDIADDLQVCEKNMERGWWALSNEWGWSIGNIHQWLSCRWPEWVLSIKREATVF